MESANRTGREWLDFGEERLDFLGRVAHPTGKKLKFGNSSSNVNTGRLFAQTLMPRAFRGQVTGCMAEKPSKTTPPPGGCRATSPAHGAAMRRPLVVKKSRTGKLSDCKIRSLPRIALSNSHFRW